ncbi:MAG: alanine dehydrogenase [Spirochaetia bacterium]|nr:alanine dehydrogenase [Spirochaetia bacterium]
MKIGVLKEIKNEEMRVALTPYGAEELHLSGHDVYVQKDAGKGSGFTDEEYVLHGAKILSDAESVFKTAEMVLHVKEPQHSEYKMIRKGQIIFTFLHLANEPELTQALIKSECVAIGYETVTHKNGTLPILAPMSEIAGRVAIHEGAKFLEMHQGGSGILLGGVPGVEPATVMILGGGMAGLNAAKIASGMGAKVYILDKNIDRLRYLSDILPPNCITLMSSPAEIRRLLPLCDLVIGAVLIPGDKTPRLITREQLKTMKNGSVLVDISIDQGGCFETSRATTHDNPIYIEEGIVHFCVSNIPGAVPRTSTMALTNVTLPYIKELSDKGWKKALKENAGLLNGGNVINGKIVCEAVSRALGLSFAKATDFL